MVKNANQVPKLQNYKHIFQPNKNNPSSGGLIIYYRKNLKLVKLDTNTSSFESLAVRINNICFVAIYVHPQDKIDDSELINIMNMGIKSY